MNFSIMLKKKNTNHKWLILAYDLLFQEDNNDIPGYKSLIPSIGLSEFSAYDIYVAQNTLHRLTGCKIRRIASTPVYYTVDTNSDRRVVI